MLFRGLFVCGFVVVCFVVADVADEKLFACRKLLYQSYNRSVIAKAPVLRSPLQTMLESVATV